MNTAMETLYERAPDKCVQELASSILEQAVMDWKYKCERIHISYRKRPEAFVDTMNKRKAALSELRRFFRSDWCSILCGDGVNRNVMLKSLEEYYRKSQFAKQVKAWEAGEL